MNSEHSSTQRQETPCLRDLVLSWGVDPDEAPRGLDPNTADLIRQSSSNSSNDELEMVLDDIANDILRQYPQSGYHANIKAAHGKNLEAAREATRRQRALFALVIEVLLAEVRLENNGINEEQRVREAIWKTLVAARERDGDNYNPLRVLGIITTNNEGVDVFQFPRNRMPKGTVEKWDAYMRSVTAHIKAENDLRSGRGTREALIEADRVRKNAHDLLTNDMMRLLGMDDFEEMRRTVAKMRDGSFPNIATSEEERVNAKLRQGIPVTDAIREHLFPEGAFLPDPDYPKYGR